ncbi:MAG: DUF418 domain-containing protein [Phycisphaerales bacterium]
MTQPEAAVPPSSHDEPKIGQPPAPRLGPVAQPDRIDSMDIARGFALLGILCANIVAYSEPVGRYLEAATPVGEGRLGTALHQLVHVAFQGKTYPLFCTLFGMGLALQQVRGRVSGRFSGWLQVRRLLVLAIVGVLHIVFFWSGDILFTYALVGLAVFWALRLSPRRLLVGAMLLLLVSSLLAGAFSMAMGGGASKPGEHPAARWVPPPVGTTFEEGSPVRHVWAAMQRTEPRFKGPQDQAWMDAEAVAFRDGPYSAAIAMRLLNYAGYIFAMLFGAWQLAALMLIGSVLVQTRFLAPERRAWQWRMVAAAALVGFPASFLFNWLAVNSGALPRTLAAMAGKFTYPLISLGYLAAWALIANAGLLRPLTRLLAAAGRMALTNYLTHTVVCAFVFQHWGLARYGSWSVPEMMGLVLALFTAQLFLSALWLRAFRFGPLEWVWRTLAYLRPQPMLRRVGTGD